MRWQGRRQSSNVSDRRGLGGPVLAGGTGLIIALIYVFLGGDPSVVLNDSAPVATPPPTGPAADADREFVSVVLADTEDVWHKLLADEGRHYQEPTLVLFSDRVQSACGLASSAVGPFYCPTDYQVYLDTAFFSDLQRQLGAGGDFARAYVIAHEVGHHVQNLLGTMERVDVQRQRASETDANRLSVAMELQADCYAGVWAKQTEEAKQVLEAGDLEEAMAAAAAVGDDRLQRRSRGTVVPDSFTHGTSEQRMAWFDRGFRRGAPADCDTFGVAH